MSLDIRPVVGSTKDERTLGWFLDAHHDWTSFLPGMNWRDFTFVHLGGEWNSHMGRVELDVAILGLHARISYVWDDTAVCEMMADRDEVLPYWPPSQEPDTR